MIPTQNIVVSIRFASQTRLEQKLHWGMKNIGQYWSLCLHFKCCFRVTDYSLCYTVYKSDHICWKLPVLFVCFMVLVGIGRYILKPQVLVSEVKKKSWIGASLEKTLKLLFLQLGLPLFPPLVELELLTMAELGQLLLLPTDQHHILSLKYLTRCLRGKLLILLSQKHIQYFRKHLSLGSHYLTPLKYCNLHQSLTLTWPAWLADTSFDFSHSLHMTGQSCFCLVTYSLLSCPTQQTCVTVQNGI